MSSRVGVDTTIRPRFGAWGSRYPHHDASDAREAVRNLEEWGAPGDAVRRLMGENAARFFGIEQR